MIYHVLVTTNDRAKLIVDEISTRSEQVAQLVAKHYDDGAHIVTITTER